MDIKDYLIYGFTFEKEEVGYSVFPSDEDSKNGLFGATCGNTYDNAYYMAQWFVRDVADFNYFDFKYTPKSSGVKEGQVAVNIGIDSALKIMLRNLMLETQTDIKQLAKLMGISTRILKKQIQFSRSTKIEILAKAFEVLGHPLKITC